MIAEIEREWTAELGATKMRQLRKLLQELNDRPHRATSSGLSQTSTFSGAGHLKATDDHGVGFCRRVSLTDDRLIRG